MKKLNYLFLIPYFLMTSAHCIAQKLPNKQKISIWAPADIKIDGKATEWGDKYAAYNSATNIHYTLSNDEDNIYIIFNTDDPDALTKITNKGFVFWIAKNEKEMKAGHGFSLTYPYFTDYNKPYINFKNKYEIKKDDISSLHQADSLMDNNNKNFANKVKYFKVTGAAGLDTVISVYNENGIKASARFDNRLVFTCELVIPLKYLGVPSNSYKGFFYRFLFPGMASDDFGIKVSTNADGTFLISAPPGAGGGIPSKDHFNGISSNTDFSGEYTLAKKP